MENGLFPLLAVTNKDNYEMVKLLIEYANKHNIILELNEKNENREYPLLSAVHFNNDKIVELLIEYSENYNLFLELNEKTKKLMCIHFVVQFC